MPEQPHGILPDEASLRVYQQLCDDLRVFEGVLMYHFFKKPDAQARQEFADAAGATFIAFYHARCKAIGQVPDCGTGCWDGTTCRDCFAAAPYNGPEQVVQQPPMKAD